MRLISSLIISVITFAGCATSPAPSDGTLAVTASFYPLAFLAESIGGDAARVSTITPTGAEPHDYEPTPKEITNIYGAKVFVYLGAGVDPWAARLAPDLIKETITTLEATAGMTLRSGSAGNTLDPHIWLDPVLLRSIATRVRDTMIAADPMHRATFEANAAALDAKLAALDEEFRSTLGASCRLREVIVSHDAFEYLGARYGITMLPIAGLSPEAEPSPARIADLAVLAKAKGIHYVTFETLASPRIAETLASEVGAKTLVLDPIEGLTMDEERAGDDLIALMRKNLTTLATAMECKISD